MKFPGRNLFTISDADRERYLDTLDQTVGILADHVEEDATEWALASNTETILRYGWRTDLTPFLKQAFQGLSDRLKEITTTYDLFRKIHEPGNKGDVNRAYVDSEIKIDDYSGLPSVVLLRELRGRKSLGIRRSQIPTDGALVSQLANVYLGDETHLANMEHEANVIEQLALQSNFQAVLEQTDLPDLFSAEPQSVRALGTVNGMQTVYEVTYFGMMADTSVPQITTVLIAQDPLAKHIELTPDGPVVDDGLKFPVQSEEGRSWYLLKRIDRDFERLHPLFTSTFYLGPFHSSRLTRDKPYERLQTMKDICAEDDQAHILQGELVYAFSPDTATVPGGEQFRERQLIPHQEFSKDIFVTPGRHSATIANKMGGDVKVYEYLEESR